MKYLKHTLHIFAYTVVSFCLLYSVAGCGGGGSSVSSAVKTTDPEQHTTTPNTPVDQYTSLGKWTVLVYMDGDNNLESYAMQNINQMERVGSSANVRVVVQIDRSSAYDQSDNNWTDARRYLIQRDTNPETLNSLRLDSTQPLGELDMADPDNLRDFVEWGVNKFPAEHYCVILWNHGTGWELTSAVSRKFSPNYVLSDDSSGNAMNVTDIPYALSMVKPDILAFDACYMQQVEVAYQLRNCADYMIGSTGSEPSEGFKYDRFLAQMGANSTPLQVGKSIVDTFVAGYRGYSDITLSMIDLSQITEVAAAVNEFAGTLQSNQASWANFMEQAREQSIDYSEDGTGKSRYLIDMADYAKRCSTMLGGSVMSSSQRLTDSIKQAVVAEGHSFDSANATGLSIYFPEHNKYDSNYSRLDFARSTSWDTLISTL